MEKQSIIKWEDDSPICPQCGREAKKTPVHREKDFDNYSCSSCGAIFSGVNTPGDVEANVFLFKYIAPATDYRETE